MVQELPRGGLTPCHSEDNTIIAGDSMNMDETDSMRRPYWILPHELVSDHIQRFGVTGLVLSRRSFVLPLTATSILRYGSSPYRWCCATYWTAI